MAQRLLEPGLAWGRPLDHGAVTILVAVPMGLGAAYLALPWMIRTSRPHVRLVGLVLATGLAMRLLLFGTEPALEDDSYRYLWDGAVVLEGIDLYRFTQEQAFANPEIGLRDLALDHPAETARVNHPWLRTPYPPVAQAGFALAALVAPFDADAWRAVVLAGELAALGTLWAVLRSLNRSPLWLALYWWNPLAAREFAGAAHMAALAVGALALALA